MGEIKEDDPELCKTFVCNTNAKAERTMLDQFEEFSDWLKLIRALAILIRKIKEYKGNTVIAKGSTSLAERKQAKLVVIKFLQAKVFSREIKILEAKKVVAKTKDSKLYKLSPLLDEGVLRVGGRLSHAVLHPYVRHAATTTTILQKVIYPHCLSDIFMQRFGIKNME